MKKIIFTALISMLPFTSFAQSVTEFMGQRAIGGSPILNQWDKWDLVIVALDKNDKPIDEARLGFIKPVTVSKKNGPQISIENISMANNNGKIVRVSCDNNMTTQKFETTQQLPGWALQMTCSGSKYYLIINPVK